MFKRFKHFLALFAILLVIGIMLGACGTKDTSDTPENNNENEVVEDDNNSEDEEVVDEGPQEGGTIVGAMHTAPTGQFNPIFYEEAYEANIIEFTFESLFTQNAELEYETNGLAEDFEINEEHTEMVVHLREDVKWHDGEVLTADDVVFTYQAIADPDYEAAGGVRTNPYVSPLLGFEEYRAGDTDEFKGVVAEDELTVVFHFEEPSIHPQYIANFPIIPKHVYEDIPVADMPDADESLKPGALIGTGPFKFTEMVEREQYVLERHEDYWQGTPYLESIVWRIIEESVIPGLLETGEVDFVAEPGGIPPSEYELVSGFDHVEIIEQADFGYQLLGFKHNHRTTEDVEAGLIEPDNWVPNEKMPQEVRQAIAYAIDRDAIVGSGHGEGLLHGRGQPINSPIAPQFWAYDDEAAIDYTYDPDKAAEILDDAGYTMGDDGWRTDPDGNEWVINMDYPLGNELRERAAPIIEEFIEDVGIQVDLRQPQEMSAYVPALTDDNSDWDLYLIGWSLGSGEPDPLGLWGIKDAYNFSRWNNPESDEMLFDAIKAPDAFDQDYRADIYSEWTYLFSEDLPALLLFAENKLWTYNTRIQDIVALPHTMYQNSHLWWVTEE